MFTSIYFFFQWRNVALVSGFFVAVILAVGLFAQPASALAGAVNGTPKSDCRQAIGELSAAGHRFTTVDTLLVNSFFPIPKGMIVLSPVCDVSVLDNSVALDKEPSLLTLSYADTLYRPRVSVWDFDKNRWVKLISTMNRKAQTVSADIPKGDHIIVAVFADGSDAHEGIASWYAHKRYPSGSATNLFPIGTKLKVTNAANKKSTTVTVTSTWTNKNEKRIIDLVSTAFKKIAKLGEGLINVRIERLD
ncbi:hypothetical protein HY732_04190 [Candidatus Uhrbacteria bacterium]|nr:hypothetical protein [Candidatus Uhrbacteria bacterium]